MAFRIESVRLGDVVVIVPDEYRDPRGAFQEAYRRDHFEELGLPGTFVQENQSRSIRGVVRGLHFQWQPAMAKVMRVVAGAAWLVAVDIRPGSPTLGEWFGVEATADNRRQLFAPPGFARGFCALSDVADVQYKCTATYRPDGEAGILWNDPAIGIRWPTEAPILSDRDRDAQTLESWLARPESDTFRYRGS